MKEFYHKWYSQYISRDFEMLVFGERGIPVILFPTFNGKYFEYKDNKIIESAADLVENGKIKIYCPDNFNYSSWHNYEIHPADRAKSHLAYERLIINDVIGFAKYETEYQKFVIGGFEFGAYHSLNLTLRHPELVSNLLCTDGFYDIRQFVFGYYDDNCYFNNPVDYLPNLQDKWFIENLQKILIEIASTDKSVSYDNNYFIHELLLRKKIKNNFFVNENDTDKISKWSTILKTFLNQLK